MLGFVDIGIALRCACYLSTEPWELPVFDFGIEEHRLEGQRVRDVALEALTRAWRGKRPELEELNRIGKRLRVQRVMQPYLETVVL